MSNENVEEIKKIQLQQEVLLCQYDGKHTSSFEGKKYCLYNPEVECKYRVSFTVPEQAGIGTHLDYLCQKWGGVSQK